MIWKKLIRGLGLSIHEPEPEPESEGHRQELGGWRSDLSVPRETTEARRVSHSLPDPVVLAHWDLH